MERSVIISRKAVYVVAVLLAFLMLFLHVHVFYRESNGPFVEYFTMSEPEEWTLTDEQRELKEAFVKCWETTDRLDIELSNGDKIYREQSYKFLGRILFFRGIGSYCPINTKLSSGGAAREVYAMMYALGILGKSNVSAKVIPATVAKYDPETNLYKKGEVGSYDIEFTEKDANGKVIKEIYVCYDAYGLSQFCLNQSEQ